MVIILIQIKPFEQLALKSRSFFGARVSKKVLHFAPTNMYKYLFLRYFIYDCNYVSALRMTSTGKTQKYAEGRTETGFCFELTCHCKGGNTETNGGKNTTAEK